MPIDYDNIADKFLGTDEGEAWDELVQAVRAAESSGAKEAMMPTAFLFKWLPELATDPFRLDFMRTAWNRTCDENGAPERRKE